MRCTFWIIALVTGGVVLKAFPAWADYPPYTSASAPSDTFRISDTPSAPEALPPAQAVSPAPAFTPTPALAPVSALPAEVPWGQTNPSGGPIVMGSGSRPVVSNESTTTSTIISPAPATTCVERLVETTVYTRVDYFHWNERSGGVDFLNEDGVLNTLGYQVRYNHQRARVEIFGGNVNYGAPMSFAGDPNDFFPSHTEYLGGRVEYELVFNPEVFPSLSWFVGLGTRFWDRDLPGGATDNGYLIEGYREDWVTMYPYLGLETRRAIEKDTELYGMGRIGLTAFTSQTATINDAVLHPGPGVTAQLEGGARGKNLFAAAFFEAMSWSESPKEVSGGFYWWQPKSAMYTVGLKTGVNF